MQSSWKWRSKLAAGEHWYKQKCTFHFMGKGLNIHVFWKKKETFSAYAPFFTGLKCAYTCDIAPPGQSSSYASTLQ
jgi:hypothetical protein